ncbi:MAG: serine hydrolase [Candidatus Pedobacter colombiensis]|uniref:Serine hydrolase n=1 Tax=Candidatus Pedobacter colombiensis TaxID=3121371 RepID=A0AAJ5WB24_9SPHI|nr:serine hydrolase [Pedobacter sp.]WEK21050.1 MAG: serine hydrolase [Pedobacter sp.]
MQIVYKKLLLVAALLCGTGLAKAQTKQILIDSLITRSNQLGLFNGNVLIIEQGGPIYRKAIGYTDASKQTLLTDQYRFHIGSIAKEFNAIAIMTLKEQGKLNIDDKISKYLTKLPKWAQTISIKNLLQYASGLPNLKWKDIQNDAAAMDSLKSVAKLDFEPGTQYAYNNSNILLQRQIVEQITGMKFADFVTKKILKPLKMTSSLVDPNDTTPLMAKSYNNNGVPSPLASPISGWTAVTLDDFYKWEQNLEHFKLISIASTKVLLTPFGPNKQCGLGGGKIAGDQMITHTHDGTALNYQALLTANFKQGRTVILLTNNKQNNLYDINNAIQSILDGKPYLQPKKQVINALEDKPDKTTGTELLAAYQELKTKHSNEYSFDESALNTLGYSLLNKKRYDDAILIFEHNITLFPKSGNVYDSLAEAYYNKGDKVNALLNYKRVLELDPSNNGARKMITLLQQPY